MHLELLTIAITVKKILAWTNWFSARTLLTNKCSNVIKKITFRKCYKLYMLIFFGPIIPIFKIILNVGVGSFSFDVPVLWNVLHQDMLLTVFLLPLHFYLNALFSVSFPEQPIPFLFSALLSPCTSPLSNMLCTLLICFVSCLSPTEIDSLWGPLSLFVSLL